VFCRYVLKVSKVLRTSPVIVCVKFVRSFPYLLATATSINLTNSSGVRLGVTVDVAVAVVVMVGTIFLITPVRVFGKHVSFLLLTSAIYSLCSFSSALLSAPGRCSIATPVVLWGPTSIQEPLSSGLLIALINQRRSLII
jgi:hypothetical protein